MEKFSNIESQIKKKIKQLLVEKKVNKSQLSLSMDYNKNFLSYILCTDTKFFNLEHIEKICNALDYPVARLFEEDNICPKEGSPTFESPSQPQSDPLERAMLEMFRKLSSQGKGELLGDAEELQMREIRETTKDKKEVA